MDKYPNFFLVGSGSSDRLCISVALIYHVKQVVRLYFCGQTECNFLDKNYKRKLGIIRQSTPIPRDLPKQM